MTETNCEGLTFGEWVNAALAWTSYEASPIEREQYRGAWLAGEDPTDYAATLERVF